MKKILVFILLITFTTGMSYLFNGDLYKFYLSTYYKVYRKGHINEFLREIETLANKKKHKEFKEYRHRLEIVYPGNKKLKRVIGLYYMENQKEEQGIQYIISSLEYDVSEYLLIKSIIPSMMKLKLYGDIAGTIRHYAPEGDRELSEYYGISLFYIKEYATSLKYFKNAVKMGSSRAEIYHYMGLIYENLGDDKTSIKYLEAANIMVESGDRSVNSHRVKKSLARLYKKSRLYKESDDILKKLLD